MLDMRQRDMANNQQGNQMHTDSHFDHEIETAAAINDNPIPGMTSEDLGELIDLLNRTDSDEQERSVVELLAMADYYTMADPADREGW